MPSLSAFWRIEATERFICLLILMTGVLAFECARSALTSSLVNGRAVLFAFFAICTSLIDHCNDINERRRGQDWSKRFSKIAIDEGSIIIALEWRLRIS